MATTKLTAIEEKRMIDDVPTRDVVRLHPLTQVLQGVDLQNEIISKDLNARNRILRSS
jgi:hypothetical protein